MLVGQTMTSITETLLTLDELSKYLQVSKSTLYKLVQAGRVPGTKIGKHWRFRKATIDLWIDGNQQESTKIKKK